MKEAIEFFESDMKSVEARRSKKEEDLLRVTREEILVSLFQEVNGLIEIGELQAFLLKTNRLKVEKSIDERSIRLYHIIDRWSIAGMIQRKDRI